MNGFRAFAAPGVATRSLWQVESLHARDGHVDRFRHRRIDVRFARRNQDGVDGQAIKTRDLFADVGVATRADARDGFVGHPQGVGLAGIAPRFDGPQGRFGFGRISFEHRHSYLPSS